MTKMKSFRMDSVELAYLSLIAEALHTTEAGAIRTLLAEWANKHIDEKDIITKLQEITS